MNGKGVQGKLILVKPAEGDAVYDSLNENLYVRNIPSTWNEETIRQFFEAYGPTVSVRMMQALPNTVGQVAMVKFAHAEHAQAARDNANATTPPGEALALNVKYADTPEDKARKQQTRAVKAAAAATGMPLPAMSGMSATLGAQQRYAPYPGAGASGGRGGPAAGGAPPSAAGGGDAGGGLQPQQPQSQSGPQPASAAPQPSTTVPSTMTAAGYDGYGSYYSSAGYYDTSAPPLPGQPQQQQAQSAASGTAAPAPAPWQQAAAQQQPTPAPKPALPGAGGAPVPALTYNPASRILVYGMPDKAGKLDMYENFARFGAVTGVRVGGGPNGFGVVQYGDRESALRALAAMNGATVMGGYQLRVTLSESASGADTAGGAQAPPLPGGV
ncbi:hypothetical protein GPECTOR_4g878 [Gonium pectorale]|uniref:RRM domain-containing protein n=1 Tax=Gonium pectorale TaxID=33097 RepID=A0A150GY31_GONPE|nr:hypothetical protein GPECTOR_4g878 [Gonium pectorale]|eukprot:KXZ54807.1 hypothetical protein GPECTOR_4g878 [Gonium pectorale]